jgi:6-phospho-beta-glucosidase
MPALAILGGSTPFTVSLLDLLPDAGRWDVTLHGRDADALSLIAGFGHSRLQPQGGTVRWTTDLDDALVGADVVLHQIRYGDLVGRAGDERLAESLGVAGDETLGPSGLRSAIRMAPALAAVARAMSRQCPDACVVNLTNPLSCSTAILVKSGLRKVIGLCELPQFTLQQACAALNLSPDAVTWDYVGLNHRGFIHVLDHAGRNVLDDLPAALGDREIGGIGAEDIAELGALPLKYFRLLAGRNRTAERRAQALLDLKSEALAELRIYPTQVPAALRKRQMPWYPDAVLPVLRTLASGKAGEHVLNLPAGDGIVREFRAILRREGAEPLPSRQTQGTVRRWLDRFDAHEHATLAAVLDPVRPRIREALALDPMLPAHLIDRAADLIAPSKAAGVQADA